MNIQPYLHYYLGCQVIQMKSTYPHKKGEMFLMDCDRLKAIFIFPGKYKPVLRRLSSLTEVDMFGILNCMIPVAIEDLPTIEDYDFEMFYNDNATMVDGDIAAGANYSCSCYTGQIAITHDGTIEVFGEEGEREKPYNLPKAYSYLLANGFWLFGDEAFTDRSIIDAATIK